ncbi:MAG: cell division protein [Cytophagaceae bacterium]|nr:cell division protein [Cytophagaceae bacterium]
MNIITLHTTIDAPIETVFDLARSIDFHQQSASKTKETAIAGVTTGLIGYNQTVTWKGKHFGSYLTHQSKITAYRYPTYFSDTQLKGHFTYFHHEHIFTQVDQKVCMKDILYYSVPYGVIGRLFNWLLLRKHLTSFLQHRNNLLKDRLER